MLYFKIVVSSLVEEMLDQINLHRKGCKLTQLEKHDALQRASDYQANVLCYQGKLSHEGMDRSHLNLDDRLRAYDFVGENIGENIAKQEDEDFLEVIRLWVKSDKHRKNIYGDYNFTGLSTCKDKKGNRYWVQVFGKGKKRNLDELQSFIQEIERLIKSNPNLEKENKLPEDSSKKYLKGSQEKEKNLSLPNNDNNPSSKPSLSNNDNLPSPHNDNLSLPSSDNNLKNSDNPFLPSSDNNPKNSDNNLKGSDNNTKNSDNFKNNENKKNNSLKNDNKNNSSNNSYDNSKESDDPSSKNNINSLYNTPKNDNLNNLSNNSNNENILNDYPFSIEPRFSKESKGNLTKENDKPKENQNMSDLPKYIKEKICNFILKTVQDYLNKNNGFKWKDDLPSQKIEKNKKVEIGEPVSLGSQFKNN